MSFPDTATLERRLSRVRETLDSLGLDALIVTDLINIRYLSNHIGSAGVLVLTREAVHLLIDFRYDTAVRDLQRSPAACPGLRTWAVPGSYDEALAGCLVELGAASAGFEATHLSVARHEWLIRTLAARQKRSASALASRLPCFASICARTHAAAMANSSAPMSTARKSTSWRRSSLGPSRTIA